MTADPIVGFGAYHDRLREEEGAKVARPTESLRDFCELMYPGFRAPRHLARLMEYLEALERREISRLMVFMPPRSGKTLLTSQLYPAYWMGRHPRDQIILLSYGADLAEENSAVARDYFKDSLWPFRGSRLSPTTRATSRWKTTAGGICVGVGFGGVLGGRGAHLISCDDPTKNLEDAQNPTYREKQWGDWCNVVRPRLMFGGVALLTTTRWVEDDLAGRLLNEPGAKDWTVLSLPLFAGEDDALGRAVGEPLWDPDDIPFGDIPSEEEIGRRAFAALYQQAPFLEGGNYFTEEPWRPPTPAAHHEPARASPPSLRPLPMDFHARREDGMSPRERLRIYQFWDVAFSEASTADWTVGITVGLLQEDLTLYVLDVVRKHVSPYTMGQEMAETAHRWRPVAIGIESNAFRQKIVEDLTRTLRSKVMARVLPVPVDRDKETRAGLPRERAEAGKLFVDSDAPWYPAFATELLAFPAGKHDDQVDALSGACELVRLLVGGAETHASTYVVRSFQLGSRGTATNGLANLGRRKSSNELWRELRGQPISHGVRKR